MRNATIFLTLALTLVATTALVAADRAAQGPNIVLCMADDQGWGDVGFRDHPVLKTPTMDELAHTALRLERFYAAAPVCSPTRGSVLTGRHPNRFGCFSWGHTLRPQEITVAEALRGVGYTTGHFGKWHLGSLRADSPVCPGNSGFDRWMSSPNFYENDPLMSFNGVVRQTKGESSQVAVDAAVEFIHEAVEQQKPFLAVVWFGSPHGPHIATEKFRQMYADQPQRLQHFYGELTGIDHALGNLRRELRELGVADNTLLWYTSDNGALPIGSTGGLSGRKGNLGEGGIREPTMIEWPNRIKAARISQVPCGTVDIYPTLLEVAGVKIDDQPPLDGVSLLPLIDGRMVERSKPLGFWVHPTKGISTKSTELLRKLAAEQSGQAPATAPPDQGRIVRQYSEDELLGPSAWIDGRFKLHRKPSKSGDQVICTLFDLVDDPAEQVDLAPDQPQRVRRMRVELEAWQKSVVRSMNGEDYAQ